MPNLLQRLRDAVFPPSPQTPINDPRSDPYYRMMVADHLERAGVNIANATRPGTTYLADSDLSRVFHRDAARQPGDARRKARGVENNNSALGAATSSSSMADFLRDGILTKRPRD